MMGMNALTVETELYRYATSEPQDSAESKTENVRRVQRTMVVRLIEDAGTAAVGVELEQFAVVNIIEDLMGRAGTVFLIDKSTIGLVLYGARNELTDEAMEQLRKFLGSVLTKYAKVQARIGIGDLMHTFLDLNRALATALAAVEVSPPCEEQSTHPFVEEAKTILQRNYGDGVCLKSIAKELYVNPAYLGRLFKSYESISFNDYLIQVRMEKAKELLIGTDKRIYEIAHEVGYRQLDWFYKKFKEYAGCSAKEYKSVNM